VQFRDAAEFDTDGLFDPGGDRTSLRATRPGTYIAMGEITWDRTSGNGYRSAEIMLGGNSVSQAVGPPLPEGVYTTQQVTAIVRMGEGDIVQLGATQSSGAGLVISAARLSLAWLGPRGSGPDVADEHGAPLRSFLKMYGTSLSCPSDERNSMPPR
jgi:hypothetical protein